MGDIYSLKNFLLSQLLTIATNLMVTLKYFLAKVFLIPKLRLEKTFRENLVQNLEIIQNSIFGRLVGSLSKWK